MRNLLHISDIHFGPPHLSEVSEAVLELIEERAPDLVVVSGDMTQRAKPEQFRQARDFVDRMVVPSIAVPGNHDVPMYRVWERLLSPYGAYRKHFSSDMEPLYQDDEMWVVGINSAFNWTVDNGHIRLDRLLEVGELLRSAPEDVFRLVVVHHHLIPPPRFSTQRVLKNAFEAVEVFSSGKVDLVLSGHLHQAYIGSSEEFYPMGGWPVLIAHSGTTTSNRGRGAERNRNSCNWIRLDSESITIWRLFWHPVEKRFEEHSRHEFPRRPAGPGEVVASLA